MALGLFSCIMRDLANMSNDNPKWIVLDGDIDPMWIESLNTVMDDNKVSIEMLLYFTDQEGSIRLSNPVGPDSSQ